jgi:glycosyltransferase involved in cell wall biosynthesis
MHQLVCIDATAFEKSHPTGVEITAQLLLPRLSVQLLADGMKVTWIGNQSKHPAEMPTGVTWQSSQYHTGWSQLGLLCVLLRLRPTIFFSPSGLVPLLYRGTTALIVHDLAVFRAPQHFTLGQRLRLRYMVRWNARHASVLFTPSLATKQDIQRWWPEITTSCVIASFGAPVPSSGSAEEAFMRIPFTLGLGRLETKKNPERVLRVSKKAGLDVVWAGSPGVGSELVRERPGMHAIGYVSDEQRTWLLRHAVALVIAGEHEGFCFPMLEAFQEGCPVVVADAAPLPEIAGSGALVCTTDDEFSEAISRLAGDEAFRSERIARGKERVQDFTWERCTLVMKDELLQLLRR